MARLIQASRRTLFSSHFFFSPKTLITSQFKNIQSLQIQNPNYSNSLYQIRNYNSEMRKATLDGHVLRVLRNQIQYLSDNASKPVKGYNSKKRLYEVVEDCPGERWIKLESNKDDESIKIEATMFDRATENIKKNGEEEMELHISFIVDVKKKDDSNTLHFVCSAWPYSDRLEIHKVYCIGSNEMHNVPYMGPDFNGDVPGDLRDSVYSFLDNRGIDEDFASFLHDHIMSKEIAELIRWMNKVKSFVEM